jgi:hypothetical protein
MLSDRLALAERVPAEVDARGHRWVGVPELVGDRHQGRASLMQCLGRVGLVPHAFSAEECGEAKA